MGKITIRNIRLYAYHGCLEEESLIGSDYLVSVEIATDLKKAAQSDDLDDTVDYVRINAIVKQEMKIRSKLLEHAAKRVLDRIFAELPVAKRAKVSISKLNPPIGGDVQAVTVTLKEKSG